MTARRRSASDDEGGGSAAAAGTAGATLEARARGPAEHPMGVEQRQSETWRRASTGERVYESSCPGEPASTIDPAAAAAAALPSVWTVADALVAIANQSKDSQTQPAAATQTLPLCLPRPTAPLRSLTTGSITTRPTGPPSDVSSRLSLPALASLRGKLPRTTASAPVSRSTSPAPAPAELGCSLSLIGKRAREERSQVVSCDHCRRNKRECEGGDA